MSLPDNNLFTKDLLELIKSRRSTRSYSAESVREEDLSKIIEAGRYAPSGGNNQLTHFLVITDPSVLKALSTIVKTELSKMEISPATYRSLANNVNQSKTGKYDFIYGAPVLIITASRSDYLNSYADCACAIENMLLMATALGLGSCWVNQLRFLNENENVNSYLRELGMGADETVFGSLVTGHPKSGELNRTPIERKGNTVTRK